MALKRPQVKQAGQPPLAELANLWRAGLNASHDAGCGCGGLFVPAISAGAMEEDFLDYLRARYVRENLDELAAFVNARQRDATRGTGANTFESWIVGLDGGDISRAARQRLVADIYTFVESMGGGGTSRPGVCY